ncbi:exported hypothetical protein [Rhodococcus sp. RD6.2]|nr:exported hypothetical protein [Rhodococcus sp. RD6.2]
MSRFMGRRIASAVVTAAVLAGGLAAGAGSASAAGSSGAESPKLVGSFESFESVGSVADAFWLESVIVQGWSDVGSALRDVLGLGDFCGSSPVSIPPYCEPLS